MTGGTVTKKYGNSRIERQKFWRRIRIYSFISGGLLLVILIAYLFIGSPLFKFKTIEVMGIDESYHESIVSSLSFQVIKRKIGGFLGSQSYFAWNSELELSTPQVMSVRIEKDLFDRSLIITVVPRERYVVWCTSEDCYWVDHTGILFEKAPETEGQLVLMVKDTENLNLGDTVLKPDQFEAVSKILAAMLSQHIGIRETAINRPLQEIHLTTLTGTKILMSLRFDPSVTAIPAIERFSKNPGLRNLEYLNLTVENRAFVKER